MRASVLIKIENALSKDGVSGPVTDPGMLLLQMLGATGHRLFFLTDGDQHFARNWLTSETTIRENFVVLDSKDDDPITSVRHLGFEVVLFVAADPRLISYAMDKGVPAWMFVAPEYIRPEFRPDYRGPVKAWGELVDAIDARRAQRSEDDRLGDGFVDGRFGE